MKVNIHKLMKIDIGHNVNEATDFENVVKCLMMRILRRKYPNCPIYSEYNPENPNASYPDIYIKIKNQQATIFELQWNVNETWAKRITEQYPENDVIIIPLQLIKKKWELRKQRSPSLDMFELLKEIIGEYI